MLVGSSQRFFGATPEPTPGPASGRRSANTGFYNKRFEPSHGRDGNYFDDNQAIFRGADGTEAKQTNRDPNAFNYSNNIFKNDFAEWSLRGDDYFHQIMHRFHRSNDGWTRTLLGYTGFCFLMMPQAMIWKIHFAFFSLATLTRIRDKGAEPTIDEIFILDSIFKNEKLSALFTPTTYHVIDYD